MYVNQIKVYNRVRISQVLTVNENIVENNLLNHKKTGELKKKTNFSVLLFMVSV